MRLTGGRLVRMMLAVLVLVAGALSYVTWGVHLYDRYRLAYANYQVEAAGACGTLITWSPPSDVLTALYVNQPNFLTVRYRSPRPQPLRLTLSIPHFTQEQSFDVEGTAAFHALAFRPPLVDPNVLDTLVGPHARDEQIMLQVRSANGHLCDTSTPVRLESRQMMLWQDTSGNDLSSYLAGWVTPQAAVIDTLVGRSAQRLTQHPGDYPAASALSGYDGGRASPHAVVDQVNAVFDTLQFDYHVHYVNENIPFLQSASQLIQLPKDVLSSVAPTGMCVETTAIMASAVERMGMRPLIVIVPHHAFLGVALGTTPQSPVAFWETSNLNGGVTGAQANVDGDGEYNRLHRQGQILRTIDVTQERQQGIEPIE